MKLKINMIIIAMLMIISTMPSINFASEYDISPSDLVAEGAVLINEESGQVLFDKNANLPLYPASTTKILTAIIILEDLPLDDVVTIDNQSPYAGGSSIALEPGEQLTVEQLLYGLMITSANDAAEALARYHSGSIEAFANVMNERAAEMGAINSNFVTPHGLPNNDHVTTAYDLAMIARYAMQNEMFRKIVTTKRYEIPPTNMKKDTRYLNSTNSFYQGIEGSNDLITVRGKKVPIAYEYVVGIKRGYTDEAMNCLVTSAEKDDKAYIAVVLKSNGNAMYQDTRLLLDLGLFGLSTHVLNEKEEVIDTLQINNKKETKIPLYPEHEVVIDLESDVDPASLVKKVNINSSIELPVLKGEVLGSIGYYLNDELMVSVPLISNDDFDGEDLLNDITNMIFVNNRPFLSKAWFFNLLTRLLIALLLWRSIVTAVRVQRLKRRKVAR